MGFGIYSPGFIADLHLLQTARHPGPEIGSRLAVPYSGPNSVPKRCPNFQVIP